jgi:hypothetical protein
MSSAEKKAKDIADKIDVAHFNRRLVDTTEDFLKQISDKKANLTKGDLLNLVKYVVKYPDVQDFAVSKNIQGLARTACEAKDALVATTVQVLIEEGQKRAGPQFKPQGEDDGE